MVPVLVRSILSLVFSIFICFMGMSFSTFIMTLVARDSSHTGQYVALQTWGIVVLACIVLFFIFVAGFMSASIALRAGWLHALIVGILISALLTITIEQQEHPLPQRFRYVLMYTAPLITLAGALAFRSMMRADRPVQPLSR
jgi:energy-converting hydrogenase Eha subunit A